MREKEEMKQIMPNAWADRRKKSIKWKAPMIYAIDLWEPVMDAFLDIYYQDRRNRCDNLCIYGETDTGKTTCFEILVESFKEDQNLRPDDIIEIRAAVNMTAASLYKYILIKLKWSYKSSDRIPDLELKVANAITDKRVKLIIIDELDNVMNNPNPQEQALYLQAMRNINSQTGCPLIVLGLKRVLKFLDKDNATNNRYEKLTFPKFQLKNGKWKIFSDVIGTLDKNLEQTLGIRSNFCEKPKSIEKLYIASVGKMGSLIKIYERAVKIALGDKEKKLTNEHIDRAVEKLNESKRLDDDEKEELLIYKTDNKGNKVIVGKNFPEKWYFSCPNCGIQFKDKDGYSTHIEDC
ncbi:MAG: TniB family NTP-binding protein [Candidatus Hodarchaeota archaeon]